jgi:hypothetical protein
MLILITIANEKIPPRSMTITRMWLIKNKLFNYYQKYSKFPENLEFLPMTSGKDNSINDGWGRKILYIREGPLIILKSYAKDGLEGGKKEDRDILGIFEINNLCEWKQLPK